MRVRPGSASTPTLRSIAAVAPSSNPYRPPAPPCRRLLSSRCLPELLHAPALMSPPCAAAHAFHSLSISLSLSLSNAGLTRTLLSPGRRPRPAPPSPTPRQPSCSPSAGQCSTLALLPRPPSADVVDRRPARLGLPTTAPGRPWTLPLTSLGRSSTRLSPPAVPQRCPPPLAAT
jgi:hypothetical protein